MLGLPRPTQAQPDDAPLFADEQISTWAIELTPETLSLLRSKPRAWTHATVRVGTGTWRDVAVRLKGSGTFQPIDEKPSWTLDFERFQTGRSLQGSTRFQLGNAAEDPSLLHEILGSEIFRASGIPAPRVAHARVSLNGRPLGLYILKEGFTRAFLERALPPGDGPIFDNDQGADIDQPMHRTTARGKADASADRASLKALADAARDPDPDRRWSRLEKLLDRDRFLRYLALETLVGHRDGYAISRNNYRIYLHPPERRAIFLPDGLDQLFGREPFPIEPHTAGLVASAVLGTPEGRRLYREQLAHLLDSVVAVEPLIRRIDRKLAALAPSLSAAETRQLAAAADDLKDRLRTRDRLVRRQLADPGPSRPAFHEGAAPITDWIATDGATAAVMESWTSLHIVARPGTSASWRSRCLLPTGRYRLEGTARVTGVVPRPGTHGHGAGLRIAGQPRRDEGLIGDTGERPLSYEFEVTDPTIPVELLCELTAERGECWFRLDSLRVIQQP